MNCVYYEKLSFPVPVSGMDDCFAVIIDRNDKQNDTTLHWHNSMEIVLVLEGSVQYVVDGVYHITSAGQFHLINSKSIHAATKRNPSGRIHTLVIEISDLYLKKILPDRNDFEFEIPEDSKSYQDILEILYKIVPFVNESNPVSQFALASLFNQILYILFQNCQIATKERKDCSRRVIDYVAEHYSEPLKLEDVAAYAGFQKNYFCRLFKNETGISFKYYLNYVRLNAALSLLADGQGTALDCALRSGFSSEKALIEWCHKIYDCTPTRYVKNIQKAG